MHSALDVLITSDRIFVIAHKTNSSYCVPIDIHASLTHTQISQSHLPYEWLQAFFYQAAVCTMPLMAMPHLLFCSDTTLTSCCYIKMHNPEPVAYAENLLGEFYSVAYDGHFYFMCAVCDVTIWRHITFPNQRFGEVCWHTLHVLLHALPLFYVSLH